MQYFKFYLLKFKSNLVVGRVFSVLKADFVFCGNPGFIFPCTS